MNSNEKNMRDMMHNRIKKTHKKSYFIFFEKNSGVFAQVFKSNPLYKGKKVVVLQIVYINDKLFMAEVINEEDY